MPLKSNNKRRGMIERRKREGTGGGKGTEDSACLYV